MALAIKQSRIKFFELLPLILLFFITLNGNSVVDLKFFSLNLHYILIYYWVLRLPSSIGYGSIFLAGIITDVIIGVPIGTNALSLLAVASVATYVRVVTVRISLLNDWISFIPALLLGNFIYYVALYFSDYSINYIYLFTNSVFTFIFYPILWLIFTLILKLMKS